MMGAGRPMPWQLERRYILWCCSSLEWWRHANCGPQWMTSLLRKVTASGALILLIRPKAPEPSLGRNPATGCKTAPGSSLAGAYQARCQPAEMEAQASWQPIAGTSSAGIKRARGESPVRTSCLSWQPWGSRWPHRPKLNASHLTSREAPPGHTSSGAPTATLPQYFLAVALAMSSASLSYGPLGSFGEPFVGPISLRERKAANRPCGAASQEPVPHGNPCCDSMWLPGGDPGVGSG